MFLPIHSPTHLLCNSLQLYIRTEERSTSWNTHILPHTSLSEHIVPGLVSMFLDSAEDWCTRMAVLPVKVTDTLRRTTLTGCQQTHPHTHTHPKQQNSHIMSAAHLSQTVCHQIGHYPQVRCGSAGTLSQSYQWLYQGQLVSLWQASVFGLYIQREQLSGKNCTLF